MNETEPYYEDEAKSEPPFNELRRKLNGLPGDDLSGLIAALQEMLEDLNSRLERIEQVLCFDKD